VLRFSGMRYGKIIVAALIGASLGACERAIPRTGEGQPPTGAPTAGNAPDTLVAATTPNAAPGATKAKAVPAPETVSDAFITGAVRAALMGDPGLRGADVSVNTSHGVVSLTGRVRSREQAVIAAAHAEGEDGVMRVDNTLVVLND
jgi:hyperosmotically inducible protein